MLLHATYTIMSVAAFHMLLDTVLRVDFPGPRDESTLQARFEQVPNSVILTLFQRIVVVAEDNPDDALFDVLVYLLKESGKKQGNKHLDTPNLNGETLLMGVAYFKYLYGFKTLIDAGANPNAYDSTQKSVLHRVLSKDWCEMHEERDTTANCDEIIHRMLRKLQACARFRINPTVSSFRDGKRTYLKSLKEHEALLATYFPHRVTYDDITRFIAAKPNNTVEEYMREMDAVASRDGAAADKNMEKWLSLIEICIRTNTYGPDLKEFNINDQFKFKTSEEGDEVMRMTLLHWTAPQPKYIEVMKLLLKHPGIDLNVLDAKKTAALHYAVSHDNIEALQLLIKAGAKLDLRGGAARSTALHMAIKEKHLDMVKILLDAGASPNVVETGWGKSALFFALDNPQQTKEDDIQLIKWLLAHGADLNVINRYGRTPLHIAIKDLAIKDSSLDIGQLLLEHGADPNIVDTNQETALHYAIWYNRKRKFIKLLLEKHADPNVQDKNGKTALHYAVETGKASIFEQLLNHGADPRVRDYKGQTILHYAAKDTRLDLVLQMSKLPDVNVQDNDGQTALHVAAKSHHVVMVTALLEKGADPNRQDKNGDTALHLANMDIVALLVNAPNIDVNIENDKNMTVLQQCVAEDTFTHLETVKLLLDKGADPDVRTLQNETLLMKAIAEYNVDLVKTLIDKGADPNVRWKDIEGQHTFALMMAVEQYEEGDEETKKAALDILKLLVHMPNIDLNATTIIDNEIVLTALQYAAAARLVEVVKILLAGGADMNTQNKQGKTPLMRAARSNHMNVVTALLDRGADPNVRDDTNWTALHYAVFNDHHAIVAQLLQDERIDVNTQIKQGHTPLILAAERGQVNLVTVLMNHPGIDLNLRDKEGMTALMLAARQRHMNVVTALLTGGADPNVRDVDNYSALHYAVLTDRPAILAQFLQDERIDVNAQTKEGETALMLAAELGHPFTLSAALLDRGADPNVQDVNNRTALHYAVDNNRPAILAKLLQDERIDVNTQTKEGKTPLMLAVEDGRANAVTALMNHPGIDLNLRDKEGKTALELAVNLGREECVRILSKRPEGSEPPNKKMRTQVKRVDTLPFSRLKL